MELQQLGPYRIVRKLGQGGMGEVYEGAHVDTSQRVAVKLLPDSIAAHPGFRARFEVEIETLRKLHHPHIVSLVGFGEQNGRLFYAMELVEGTNLDDTLQAGERFDWKDAVEVGIQVCNALRHAHDRGIMHRDIKPANLIMSAEGVIKLSDFGIAKLWGAGGMTAEGGLVGTANYMSPEQAEGKTTTFRSDLYSLGCTLYALIAGRPPFLSESMPTLLHMHRFEAPTPVRMLVPATPKSLDAMLRKLLEKDPAHRLPSATALAKRLEEIADGLTDDGATVVAAAPGATGRPPEADQCRPSEQHGSASTPTRGTPTVGHPTPESEPEATLASARGQPTPPQPIAAAEPSDSIGDSSGIAAVSPGADTSVDRFTIVDPNKAIEEEAAAPPPEEVSRVFTPQVLAAGLVVATIAAMLAYTLRPLSADRLVARIHERLASTNIATLDDAGDDIDEFARRFPDDPRTAEVAALKMDVDLRMLEQQLLAPSLATTKTPATIAVERAYLEAMRIAQHDPETAVGKLQAILDVYSKRGADVSQQTEQMLDLVRKQSDKLKGRIGEHITDQVLAVKRQLDRAQSLLASDPAAAQGICRGVVALYEGKYWARELVDRADELLARAAAQTP